MTSQLSLVRLSGALALVFAAGAAAETPVPVGVITARTASIAQEVALHGSLVAQRVSRLSSEADGLVEAITVDDGDVVAAGDVLVRLDDRLAAIARDAERARLAEAHARLEEAERRHAELARLKATNHAAASAVAAAAAQIKIDQALLQQAEAALARSGEMLDRHHVRAPFAAVVQRKLVEQGEWVETNTALLELVDIDVLRLEVPVPQFYFADISEDTAVSVRLDAMPERQFEARVTRRIPVSDPASRTFRVRIDIPNQERRLAPGMSARVVLRLGGASDAPVLVLPRDAVVRKPDGEISVWVIEKRDGVTTAVPRAITTGRSYRDQVEVIDGPLVAGEQVIVRGNEILRPGQSVLVAEEHGAEL